MSHLIGRGLRGRPAGFQSGQCTQQEGPQPDLRLLCFRPHEPAALQALGRPDGVEIVEFRNRLGAGRQHHPLLLGRRENVDVRRTAIRVVEGADADEPDRGTGLRVVALNRDPASGAAGDLLALAARRGRRDDFGIASGVHDTIGLIESVERMRGPGLTLAPMTMAGMDYQWGSDQTISDLPARASAFHVRLRLAIVGSESTVVSKPRFAWARTINAVCPWRARFELSAIQAKQTSPE